MRHLLRMRVGVALLALFLACYAGAQVAFDTKKFDVILEVAQDRSLTVTERIGVNFREQRRGLVRTLPVTVRSDKATRTLKFGNFSATANGTPVPVSQKQEGDTINLRIGDPNSRVVGAVEYVLKYRVAGALTNIDQTEPPGPRAELMWNAVPSDWPTGILASQVTLKFPEPVNDSFGVRALFGPRGSRAGTESFWGKKVIGRTDLIASAFVDRNLIQLIAQKPLDKGYGITVVLALPKGTVNENSDADITVFGEPLQAGPSEELPSKPWGAILPIIPVLFGLPYALKRRFIKPGPLVVRFDPPENVEPLRAAVLHDDNFQPRDLLAGLIALAQKGAGKMKVEGNQMTLQLNGSEPKSLTQLEYQLLASLKSYGPEINPDALRGTYSSSFNALGAQAKADLIRDGWRRRSHNPNWLGCGLFFLLTIVSCAGLIFTGFWVCLGFILATSLLIWITLLPTPWTPLGVQKKWELEGLKEFITRAHKDPLEFAAKHNPDGALYERILPYAIVFGLVQQWSKAFEGVQMAQPSWIDSGADSFHPWYWWFSDGYTDVSRDWSQAATPPSSNWSSGGSGLGGGYSSDGGFDGGGGFDSGGSVGDGGGGGGGGDW